MDIHKLVLREWAAVQALSFAELLALANRVGIGRDTTYRWTSREKALKALKAHCKTWA